MNRLLAACLAGLAAMSAPALAQAHEIYGQVGTEGVGMGLGEPLGTHFTARGEVNGITFSHSFSSGDLDYDAKAKILHGGIYFDFFPAPQSVPFRLTVGALLGRDSIDADATSATGTYTINGVQVSTLGETIHATARFPAVRPYVGIGFGHTPVATKGFSMFFDAGVAYGRPHVDFDVPANIVAEAGQENVDAEEKELQDKADKLRFYPIVKVGVTYRF